MSTCCVPTCGRNSNNCKGLIEAVRFYKVPKDHDLKERWMSICRIELLRVSTRVCSAHFRPTDFVTGSKRGKLIPDSVPSVNLVAEVQGFKSHGQSPISTLHPDLLKERLRRRNATIKDLRVKIKSMNVKNKALNRIISKLKLQFATRKARLEQKVTRSKHAAKKVSQQNDQLCSRFTASQVKVIAKGLSKTWWSEEDICKAICLRAKSLRAYEFVRSVYKIPLPSVSTIQRWMREIRFDPGLIHPVLNLLKVEFQTASLLKRQCAILFDEMNIEGNVAYDAAADRIYGPHTNMLVVFVRGLFSTWKQPIYFGYDEKLGPPTIYEILSKIHDVGLDVRAMTCDNAGGNIGIWTKLNVTYENTKFIHPITGKSVFCISDPPHLIKLFRNNLLDYGFTLRDGTVIQKDDFKYLLNLDKKEFRSCHKLTQKHINVVKSDRQNVRMAFETISASVAEGFKSYLPNRLRQAEFLKLANDAFDVLNSRVTNNPNPLKCSFGVHLSQQLAVLDKFYDEVDSLRVRSGRPMKHFPFQKGIMMTINSLKELYSTLKLELNIEYVSVNRLNQDIGENGFGVMRGMGTFKQNPDCVDAKYRLRMLSVGWHLLKPSRHSSVAEDEDEEEEDILGKRLLPLMQCKGPPIPPISEEVLAAISEITVLEAELDETNFPAYFQSLRPSEQAEFGGIEFLSGYVVRKLKSKFPGLEEGNDGTRDSWTRRLCLGHLTVPSLEFLNLVRNWELYFEAFHGQDPTSTGKYRLNRNFGVVSNLTTIIQENFQLIPEEIIKYYVKVRTCIRIKDVNEKVKQWRVSQRNLRKAAQFSRGAFPRDDEDDCDSDS